MHLETATVKQRVHLSPEHPDNFWRQPWSSYSSLDKKRRLSEVLTWNSFQEVLKRIHISIK
jgi:hypothetical protein